MDKDVVEKLKVQALKLVGEADQLLHQIPLLHLFAALVILLLTTFWFRFITLKRRSFNTIVLTGLCGSGKTYIFYQLRHGVPPQEGTVTSLEPNRDTINLRSEITKDDKIKLEVDVIDVPGHHRLRSKLDEFLPRAAGVVFVVDAIDFLANCLAASEYLYDILTKKDVVQKKIPVLVFCNKVDKVTAHTKAFITKQLEREIEKLRHSRTAVSDADISNEFTLGTPGEPFTFSQCVNKVVVEEGSALTGEITQIAAFIRENVRH
ncbi:unnamed protein product [Cuscuta epithymum]|uniref:Signal recognition particle receptor subunit beta n=1 Tax=Cuscuta epithymum TaxID=186058 RepID=A0AAV0E377_9ASTE|nr:unnamed protein product [Cuscuta epithymum]